MQPITRFGVCRNGSYWLLWWYDHNGVRHRENIAPHSSLSKRRAAEKGAARVMEIAHGGVPGDRDGPPLSLWLERYRTMRRHELSPASFAHIGRTCDLLNEYFGRSRKIGTIKRSEAAEWGVWLNSPIKLADGREKSRGPYTIARHVMWTKHIFRIAHEHDLIAYSPFDRVPVGQPKVDQQWDYVGTEAAEKMIAAASSPMWAATIALARYAGLRRGEIQAFRWDDIDSPVPGRMIVHRNQSLRTTKKRRRECPIQPRLREVLQQCHAAMPGTAGPWDGFSNLNVERSMRRLMKAAKVADYAKPLHTLRKSLETDWIDRYEIADVCQWLGNSPAVALAHYKRAKPESFARVSGVEPVTKLSQSPVPRLTK